MYLFTVLILSLFVTIALIPVFKSMALKMDIVDVPNSRNVHIYPMPKSGGISMAIGVLVSVLLWVPKSEYLSAVLIGSTIVVGFGLLDDINGLGYRQKFLAQASAALVIILYGNVKITSIGYLAPNDYLLPEYISILFTLFVIVGVTNAINLADGLDGLAGGVSMLSFVAVGFLAYQCGNADVAIMSIAVVGAILGLLRYNTYPATIFMGDAGSQMLGFLSIVFALTVTQSNTPYSRSLPLFLIGFPILDTLTVLVDRIVKGKSPFKADKNHFHHRLIRFGLFHSEAVFIIYILQTVLISFGLMTRFHSDWIHLLFFILFSTIILSVFMILGLKEWKFKRGHYFDSVIKGRLKILKEKKMFIRVVFQILKWAVPLFFISQCVILKRFPWYAAAIAGCLFGLTLSTGLLKSRLQGPLLKISIYTMIPVVIYYSQIEVADWLSGNLRFVNGMLFIVILVLAVVTVNITRRKKGYRINPFDFLVFVVILILPNLPTTHFEAHAMGLVAAKSLVLFFSYDILIGELRNNYSSLYKVTLVAFAALALKGGTGLF